MGGTALIRSTRAAAVLGCLLSFVAPAQTLEGISGSGSFTIGFVTDQAPFSYLSADKQATGYAVELCNRVADQIKAITGLEGLAVRYQPVTVKDGLIMAGSGQVDILCAAVTETLQRRERVSFSIPVFTSGIGVLLRGDAPYGLVSVLKGEVPHTGPRWRASINRGLVNHVYAVHAGTTGEDWVRAQVASLGVIARVVTVATHEQGVEMVLDRKADAYFADKVILEHYAAQEQHHDDLLVLDRYFTYEPLALVTRRGDEDFRLLVDTVLSELYRSADFVPLYTRYFGEPGETTRLLFKTYALPQG
jgi:polar amino acid transport system substrate-binding protein